MRKGFGKGKGRKGKGKGKGKYRSYYLDEASGIWFEYGQTDYPDSDGPMAYPVLPGIPIPMDPQVYKGSEGGKGGKSSGPGPDALCNICSSPHRWARECPQNSAGALSKGKGKGFGGSRIG